MEQQQAKFDGWALVEMMGHQREIGFVTTEYFGPAALFRVDSPEIPEREVELKRPEYLEDPATGRVTLCPKGTKVRRAAIPAKTRLVAPGAIYAMNPCSEAMAKAAIEDAVPRAIIELQIPTDATRALTGSVAGAPEDAADPEDADEDREGVCGDCGAMTFEPHDIGCPSR